MTEIGKYRRMAAAFSVSIGFFTCCQPSPPKTYPELLKKSESLGKLAPRSDVRSVLGKAAYSPSENIDYFLPEVDSRGKEGCPMGIVIYYEETPGKGWLLKSVHPGEICE